MYYKMSSTNPIIAYAVPVAVAVPVAEAVVEDLSEKEWLQKYRAGKYEFKEEDMKGFPEYVRSYVKTWPKIEDTYTFYVAPIPLDEANTAAAAVLTYQGTDAAINYMMKTAGGSYSQMRSMYG
jgi:hypothetical protein